MLNPERHTEFKFGLFSARYGNIYTAAHLLQLAERALKNREFEDTIWETDGRFFDVFRPTVEPNGFATAAEALQCRESHLSAVRRLLKQTDVFIFTFGLAEAWQARADGLVYAMCPDTVAGSFDAAPHALVTYRVAEVVAQFEAFLDIVRAVNPGIRFIMTVSLTPLLATATDQHVINATAFANVFGREEQREGLLQGFGVHAVTCIADRDHDILTRQNF